MESKSESIKELLSALSKAQGEMGVALKDSDNPFFHSTYADLASVWDVARGPLSKYGLCIIQIPEILIDGIVLITVLGHSSGEFITSHYPITPMKQARDQGWILSNDPQSIGSAITYAKRYALAAMLGIATSEDDDDGEKAMGREKPGEKPAPQKAVSKLTKISPRKAGTPSVPSPEMVKKMMAGPEPSVPPPVPVPEATVPAEATTMTPAEVAELFTGSVVQPPPPPPAMTEEEEGVLFNTLYSELASVADTKSTLKARLWWSNNVGKITKLPAERVQILRDFVNSIKNK